jgi:hypothetical protein
LKYVIRDGKLSLAWSNTNPLVVSEGDPLVVLSMKVKDPVSNPVKVFEVEGGSEFAGTKADRFDDIGIAEE